MTYCVLPGCYQPHNPDTNQVCQSCGNRLLLKERYRPLRQIGQGGFGRTFLAIDEHIPAKPSCVVKQLCLSSTNAQSYNKAVELFYQEAVRLGDLGCHSQIPTLLAYFEQNQLLYLVQEYIEGLTLAEELGQGTFNEFQIWELLKDMLPTLQFIHEQQIVHRDIKPANIIRRSHDRRIVLIDFGVAKLLTETALLRTGTIIGSLEFMAPEQTRGRTVPASDLHSLAIVCIHLMTGVPPFELFDVEHDRWNWRDRLPRAQSVSRRLTGILDKLLQSALNQRFQSATEVLQALEKSSIDRAKPKILPAETPAPTPTLRKSDYQGLKSLLLSKKWQQADTATWDLILRLLGKSSQGLIFSGNLQQIPCSELLRLDQLWVQCSQGRFGFSVQARIYQTVGKDYGAFCDRVGWARDHSRDRPESFCFKTNAAIGHLPSRLPITGQQWYRHVSQMSSHLEACRNLSPA